MSFRHHIGVLILACGLCASAVWAQQPTGTGESQGQPVPPVSPQGAAPSPAQNAGAPAPVGAASLAGPEESTPGSSHTLPSYFLPSFQIYEMGDSNFQQGTGPQGFETVSSFVGRLAFQRSGKHSQMTVDYLGGGMIFTHHSNYNSTMHQLGITETYQGRRWAWILDDRASYLPESAFGYAGFGWMGSLGPDIGGAFGSNLANQNPMFSSAQTLYSGFGSRVANTATAQVQLTTSPRSSFSLGGSFGLLSFPSGGGFNSRNALFTAGYNHAISARDTLGVTYGFNTFRYLRVDQSFRVHLVEIDYGHKITGRVAVQAGAGAQVSLFHNPVAGSDTSPSWIAHAAINYNASKNGFGLSYSRYVTNGGGVLIGAFTQAVQFSWTRQLTRHMSGSLGPGYARNTSLPQTSSRKVQYTYDSVYASASLSRSLGRNTTMFLNYVWQDQTTGVSSCPAGRCGAGLLRHEVTFGFDWHRRQLTVD